MRVAIVNLTSGGFSGGYRTYLDRLLPLLAAHARVTSVAVFVPEQARSLVADSLDVRTWTAADARRGYPALRAAVAGLSADVVFIPTARHLRFGRTPVVTMVRNMEPLTVPFGGNTVFEGVKNVARAWVARRSAERATRVIAVSEHVKAFLISRWRIDPSRVGVTYHGVDQGTECPRPAGGPIFTAGSIRPARGLEDLVLALRRVRTSARVVIAGGVDAGCEGYARRLRALAREGGLDDRITWAGHISPSAMREHFAAAGLFVMTSRAEACPNTALEAMSHGCPIVSTDLAPMPEFFGEGARYYHARDAHALAEGIDQVMSNPSDLIRLGALARRRAAHFTWTDTCESTVRQLEHARADAA